MKKTTSILVHVLLKRQLIMNDRISYLRTIAIKHLNLKSVIFLLCLIIPSLELLSQTHRGETDCGPGPKVFLPRSRCNTNSYVLVFEDDFNGNSLDSSKWNVVSGVVRDVNFELQKAWHKPENVVVSNGTLKIISKRENLCNMPVVTSWNPYTVKYEDFDYTTGEIATKYKFSFGRIEARVKIPKGKGFWPAFWMFGDNPVYNEIDIFEFWDNNTTDHHMNLHYDRDGDGDPNHCSEHYSGVDYSTDFHIFTLIWDWDRIAWYVDGSLKRFVARYKNSISQEVICDLPPGIYIDRSVYPVDPMMIILNTAIQSGSSAPNAATQFPNQLEVDWVRYYQRRPSGNVSITDPSDFPLSDLFYNLIVGDNIDINCNYNIQYGQQLDIIASCCITLGSGFNSNVGSNFLAKIEPTIFESKDNNTFYDSISNFLILTNNDLFRDNINFMSLSEINIYPNPSNGNFSIDFGLLNYQDLLLRINDIRGNVVYSTDMIQTSILSINLNSTKGVYVLYLIDSNSNEIFRHKIIIN